MGWCSCKKNKMITLSSILEFIQEFTFILDGNSDEFVVNRVSSPEMADENSLIFITNEMAEKLNQTKARIVIVQAGLDYFKWEKEKCFIISDDPRMLFTVIYNRFFKEETMFDRGRYIEISSHAEIGQGVRIESFSNTD